MERHDVVSLLVIEQDEAARMLMARQIKRRFPDVRVDVATGPEEALRYVRDINYGVVVCAVHLLQEQKISFLAKICQLQPVPKVIAVTAHTGVEVTSLPAEVQEDCVQHVVYMPVDLEVLLDAVESAIARASGTS